MIGVKCHACGKLLEVPDAYAGKTGKCNNCGGAIRVPVRLAKGRILLLGLVLSFLSLASIAVIKGLQSEPIASTRSELTAPGSYDGSMDEPAVRDGVTCDLFDVSAELSGDVLSFRLDTDLPDNADVVVSVSRSYFEKGDAKTAYSREYFNQNAKVSYWRTARTCSVADSIFVESLQEHIDMMASMSMPLEVERVADEIEVSFILPVGQESLEFGDNNANLRGSMVPESGIKALRAEVRIKCPYGRTGTGVPRVQTASHNTLEIGTSYTLTEPAPLMPEFEPAEPLLAIKNIHELPAGTVILIQEKREKRGVPWYGVQAFRGDGLSVGTGWINSIALVGKLVFKSD